MDTLLERCDVSMERFNFGVYPHQNLVNGFKMDHESTYSIFPPTNVDHNSSDSSPPLNTGSDGDSIDPGDFSHPVLKYISDILLEEDLEGKPCMLQDCMALQAAEKSFFDALNPKGPPSPNQPPLSHSLENRDDDSAPSFHSGNGTSIASKTDWGFDPSDSLENRDDDSAPSFHSGNGISIASKTDWGFDPSETSHFQSYLVESQSDNLLVSDLLSEMQSFGHFGGVGEACKFLPNGSFGTIDLERRHLMSPGPDPCPLGIRTPMRRPENDGYNSTNILKGKKNHQREDGDYPDEGRSSKQPVAFADDSEPQEMFDEVLLNHGRHHFCNKQSKGSKTTRSKQNSNTEIVDLSTLLTQCAQAVASYDQRTARERLQKIRHYSSPRGDAKQRLAHYFADGLEARLAGATTPSYSFLVGTQSSAAEILKAFQVSVSSSPFKHTSNFVANRTIMKFSENATRLHIIDFGIAYGFQWPCFIQRLSERPGGPPKLCITAIELPQPGFRPTERVEETARRLKKYAERFNVPFECNVIAQKWETIKFEDLKIDRNETTVVNCMFRLKNIPDETVMLSSASPRDIVLKLIRKINPDVFIHGVVNGAYTAPFFAARFREALFHYSALFDIFEATVPHEDEMRLLFEKAVYGRDIVNVIACEGLERLERPETYKQWQLRNVRAGFKQLPPDQELLKQVRRMSKCYHDDFLIDEDGNWMLQGWKGKILSAISIWVPA